MNAKRPCNSDLDCETWAALAHLLAAAAPDFDAKAALRGIEKRLRQRRLRRVAAVCVAMLLASSVLGTIYMADYMPERVRPQQLAVADESAVEVGLLAQTGLGAAQASGQIASNERSVSAGASPVAGAQRAVESAAKQGLVEGLGGARSMWDDDWDQRVAETQEMLLSVEQTWRRAPDTVAAMKHKLDTLEAELAEDTL